MASTTFSDGPYALSLLSRRMGPPLCSAEASGMDSADIPAAAPIPRIFRKSRREEDMLVALLEQCFYQVTQLLRSKFVSFQIGGQPVLAVDDSGMKGVNQQSLIGIKIHVEF